jgi:hypothetical protein
MSKQRERDSKMPASKRNKKVKVESQVNSTLANSTENARVGASRASIVSGTLPPVRPASASINIPKVTRQKQEKTRAKSKKTRANAHVAQEPKRQAQIKTKRRRAGHKISSAEPREAVKRNTKSKKTMLLALGKAGTEHRVSFVIRVTVDEQGQPRRTEVEHARSGKKEIFPTLNVEKLATFMRACIGSPIQSEPVSTTSPSTARPEMPTPQLDGRLSRVAISEVNIFRDNTPGIMTLTLKPDEDILVQIHFRLEGPDASSATAQESSFQIKVFAQELTGGTSKLLTIYKANLVNDVLEYAPQVKIPGLSPGIYHLIIWVTLRTPMRLAAYHESLVIHVYGR